MAAINKIYTDQDLNGNVIQNFALENTTTATQTKQLIIDKTAGKIKFFNGTQSVQQLDSTDISTTISSTPSDTKVLSETGVKSFVETTLGQSYNVRGTLGLPQYNNRGTIHGT